MPYKLAYIKNGRKFVYSTCPLCSNEFVHRSDYKPKNCGCNQYLRRTLPDNSNWKITSKINTKKCKATCLLCGTNYVRDLQALISGKSLQCKSCTSPIELDVKQQFPLGLRKHPLYAVWSGIKERCYNPSSAGFSQYGGKGVTMDNTWRNSAKTFMLWALPTWEKGLHIDKDYLSRQLGIDPPIYSPDTCKFVTPKENYSFKDGLTKANTSGASGVSFNKKRQKYESYYQLEGSRIRCGMHHTIEEAVKAIQETKNQRKNMQSISDIHGWNKKAGLLTNHSRELESSMLLEEVFEGIGINNPREAARTFISELNPADLSPVSEVEWLDHLCDLEFILHGSKCKLGLTPDQDFETIEIVTQANYNKLGSPKDELGKQLKPEGWVGPEERLQAVLDARKEPQPTLLEDN